MWIKDNIMEITMSFAAFLFLLINVSIMLGASSALAGVDKNRAKIFAIIALMLSIMPWMKAPPQYLQSNTQIEAQLFK